MYVIVRGDLTDAQKAVQGTHAAIEMARRGLKSHPSVIYVKVKSEHKLKRVMGELIDRNIQFKIFREPDKGNEITSIATVPLIGEDRQYLQKFQLV